MMGKVPLTVLRRRAEKILKDCGNKKILDTENISQLIHELTIHQIELEIQNEDLIKSQNELEESRAKYAELYDLAPVGYFSINQQGLITEVNDAGCQLLGLKKSLLINRCFSRYIIPSHQAIFSEYRRLAFKEKKLQILELKLIKWNQPSFYAALHCKVIENVHTGAQQLLTFVTDITGQKQAEEALHMQRIKVAAIDRLRSINELVYSLAQEQNNSLMMIDNYLQGCIRRLESNNYQPAELLEVLKKAALQSRTISDSVKNRMIATSKSIFFYVPASINILIKQTIALLTHEVLDYPVDIQYSEPEQDIKLKIDIFHIQQVLLNLARNAIEAMRNSRIQEPKLLFEIATTLKTVEVTLFDNGPGLSEEIIPKLFAPHFTTKSYGIGLGLVVSRAIIEKHGGQLFAIPNPSGGACFGFNLPHAALT